MGLEPKRKSVRKVIILFMLLFCVLSISVYAWNYKSFYSSTTWKKFFSSTAANSRINFRNINEELLSAAIFYETNRIRQKYHLIPFKYSRALQLAAYIHSKDMVKHNFMGHYSPVAGRRTSAERVSKYGRFERSVKENLANTIAINLPSGGAFIPPRREGEPFRSASGEPVFSYTYKSFAKKVVGDWMKISTPRANILNPGFEALGAAAVFYKGRNKIPFLKSTQVFAAKINDEIAPPSVSVLTSSSSRPVSYDGNKPDENWGDSANQENDNRSEGYQGRGEGNTTENRGTQAQQSNSSSASVSGAWSESMYSRYTYETFSRTALANKTIDFRNIDYKLLGAAIFYATNIERQKYGRSRFKFSSVLYKAAFLQSYEMVKYNFFSHTNPNAGKTTVSNRVQIYGVWKHTVGENIAYTFGIRYNSGSSFIPPRNPGDAFIDSSTNAPIPNHSYWSYALSVVVEWMHSPGHRRNILNASFRKLGAAGYLTYKGQYRMPYFKSTQVFAGGTND